jgi:hypothetical protein
VGCGSAVVSPTDASTAGDGSEPPADAPVVAVDRPTPVVDVPPVPGDVPVGTACGPANDGRYCDSLGAGCSVGGGPCVAYTSCLCGADHRWSCMSSSTGDCDGGGVVVADVSPAPVCSLVGVYFASADAMSIYFEFTADGRWRGAINRADLATAPVVEGAYTVVGATLRLTGETSSGGASTRPTTDVGRYVVAFADSCNALQLALLSDDCSGRGETLGCLAFTRQ